MSEAPRPNTVTLTIDGTEVTVDVGAIIFPKQIDIAERHVADALAKGAQLKAGGKRRTAQALGQYMMTNTPRRAIAPPIKSKRSGVIRST